MKSSRLYIVNLVTNILPETRFFHLKQILYTWAGLKVGKNVKICSSVFFSGSGEIEIGDNAWIGHRTTIISTSKVDIGKNVDIGPNVFIGTGSHKINLTGERIAGEGTSDPITLKNGCWLGAGCMILPGCNIGIKSIVAAGSVVTKTVKDLDRVAGIPAKSIQIS